MQIVTIMMNFTAAVDSVCKYKVLKYVCIHTVCSILKVEYLITQIHSTINLTHEMVVVLASSILHDLFELHPKYQYSGRKYRALIQDHL